MKIFPIKYLLAFSLICAFSALSFAQDSLIRKVIKSEGWNLPLNYEKKSLDVSVISTKDNKTVEIERFYINEKKYFNLESHRIYDGTLYIGITPCYPRYLDSYKIPNTDKVFRYSLYCLLTTVGENGNIFETNALIKAHYFDEDGDGKFEALYFTESLPNVPEWTEKDHKK